MNALNLHVLIVEDNPSLAANLFDYLEACGHRADAAPDGVSGLNLALTHSYDAIVLDWMLPRMDGIGFLKRLRREAKSTVPVIMLTAKDQLASKIEGFEAGVDDYVVKPAALPEVEIRLRAVVARTRQASAPGRLLQIDDLMFDLATLEVTRGSQRLALSPTIRRILELLMRESPRLVTRERLESLLWGDVTPETDLLRSHMHLLRKSVDSGHDTKLLHTVPGAGYRLCVLRDD